MRARATALVALASTALASTVLAGCGSDSGPAADGDGSRELTVLAAASLTGTFTTLARTFEDDHPGVTVTLAFDSSATLAEQVSQGAPADVLATADELTMQRVVDTGATAAGPEVFATNRLALVVPRDNPAAIAAFADIDDPGVDYVVCVDSAPCGALSQVVLDEQGITNHPASEEVDVKAVLSKVELDEADAGIVYETDAVASEDTVASGDTEDTVQTIKIPASADALNRYPIAALGEASDPELAQAWIDLVLSVEGQAVLGKAGFGAP